MTPDLFLAYWNNLGYNFLTNKITYRELLWWQDQLKFEYYEACLR